MVATVTAGLLGAVWLLSFVPSVPAAGFWGWIVFPCFVLNFPLFGVFMIDTSMRAGGRPSMRSPIPELHGWRAAARGSLGLVVFATLLLSFASTPSRQPEPGSGYVLESRGVTTEVTRAAWLDAKARESRWAAGISLVFAATVALTLTAPRRIGQPSPTHRWTSPEQQRLTTIKRVRGFARWRVEVGGDPGTVIARICTVVPVHVRAGPTATTWTLVADWDESGPRSRPTFPVRLEGTLALGSTATCTVDALLGPATRHASWLAVSTLGGLVGIGLGVYLFTRPGVPPFTQAFLVVWVAVGLGSIGWSASTAARTVRRVVRALDDALAAPPSARREP